MNNYLYTYSNEANVTISKFHICTWDLGNKDASVEIGVCIPKTDELPDHFYVYVFAPFLNTNCKCESLHEKFTNAENFKFIFNEKQTGTDNLGDNGRDGHIVRYEVNGQPKSMAVLKANEVLGDGYIKFSMTKVNGDYDCLYCRVYIETKVISLADVSSSISKKIYKYDFKINESRNRSNEVLNFIDQNALHTVDVSKAYCLHCVPDDFELSFSDARKLQSLRILEMDAFRRYLDSLNDVKGEYIIAFQRDELSGSGSFFTTFSRERLGDRQLTFAMAANILCNFLFAFSSWRNVDSSVTFSWRTIPYEWYVAFFIMLCCFAYCLSFFSYIKRLPKKCWNWIRRNWNGNTGH